MEVKVTENKEKKRFETVVDGKTAFMEYNRKDGKIYLTHTEVPNELEGKGIASAMAKEVLQLIKNEGIGMVSLCPFVSEYIKKHPQWKEILAKK